jgi:hypothetical protein
LNWDDATDCDFSELDELDIDWNEYDAD